MMPDAPEFPEAPTVRGSFRPRVSAAVRVAGRGRCHWTADELTAQGRRASLLVPLLLCVVVISLVMWEVARRIVEGRLATDETTMEITVKVVFLPLAIGILALVRPLPGLLPRREVIAWRDVESVEYEVDRVHVTVRRGKGRRRLSFVPRGEPDRARRLADAWRERVVAAGGARG